MKLSRKLAFATAAAGLLVAPVAAQAETRASSAPVAADVSRASAGISDQSEIGKKSTLLWLLLLLAAIAALVAAAGNGDNRTRG